MSWNWVKIKEIKSKEKYSLVGGPFGSDLSGKHYVNDGGVPVIRGGNLPFGKKFDTTDFVFVSTKKANSLKSNTAYPGDIVFTQRGTLGQVGIVPNDYERYIVSQSQMKLKVNEEKVSALFVYYYFRTEEAVIRIENVAMSSGIPHTNLGILQNFKIPLPSLFIQKRITSILSAYDDLIENNNQRIKLLENMAAEIYKEWFVRFRFPGYKEATFLDKEGKKVTHGTKGAIPEGWEKVRLDKYIDFEKGVEPGSANYESECLDENYVSFLRVGDLGSRDSNIFIKKELSKGKYVTKDDIIITLDGTVGKVAMGFEGCYSSGLRKIVYETDLIKRSFIYLTLLSANIQGTIQSHAAGTTILHASSSIKFMKILMPKENLLQNFENLVNPMLDEILLLKDKNKILQETRDLLLPRLISGKLSVEGFEM
jgi:type I restriction enzyme S subunit